MPSNYTGNPTATQAPGPQPALGALPIASLPIDGDALTAASVAQSFKESLDFAAFNAGRPINSIWGSGSDGDVNVTGSTTLTRDADYANLTIGSAGTLFTLGFVVRVKGMLTIASGGKITDLGASAKAGANRAITDTVGGSGGAGTNSLSTGSVLGGANGGSGGDGSGGGTASAGDPVTFSLGGHGASGGTQTGSGGVGGSLTGFTSGRSALESSLSMPGWVVVRSGPTNARVGTLVGIQGGSGGGGGGGGGPGGTVAGAGGGAGGGVVIVIARNVTIATNADIQAPGGVGGNADVNLLGPSGAPGGGGGGGVVLLYYGAKTGPALLASAAVPGGAAGTGAVPALSGAVGFVREFNLGY